MLRAILSRVGVFVYVHSAPVLLLFIRGMIDSKRNSFVPGRVISISSFLTVVNLLTVAFLLMSLVSTFHRCSKTRKNGGDQRTDVLEVALVVLLCVHVDVEQGSTCWVNLRAHLPTKDFS